MAVLPAEIPTGLVTGQFYFVNEDNVDADTDPNLTVIDGTVTFTCSAKLLRIPTKLATVVPLEFKGKFDSQGRIVSASDPSVGLELPATDSALFNPTGFTWKVSFDLVQVDNRHTVSLDSFNIQVPEGVTTDLTQAMPVSTSGGVLTVQGPAGPVTSMNDNDVAGLVQNTGSATATALNATYLDKVSAASSYAKKGEVGGDTNTSDTVGASIICDGAPSPLTFVTPDGGGTLTHPSVYFNPKGWNGKRYWMAVTPYDGVTVQIENPCIYSSTDGITWAAPAGVTNPIEAPPGGSAYNSDTHLLEGPDGRLYCFWRRYDPNATGAEEKIYYRASTDGVGWSDKQLAVSNAQSTRRLVSPAIVCEGGTWHLWAVDIVPSPNTVVHMTATSPTGPWSAPAVCTGITSLSGREPWHLDVHRIGSEYVMLYMDVTLDGSDGGVLYRAVSRDGVAFTQDADPFLGPVKGRWDALLYRSCLLPATIKGKAGYEVWYSSAAPSYKVGRTTAIITDVRPRQDDPQNLIAAMNLFSGYLLGDVINRADSATAPGAASSGQAWAVDTGTIGVQGKSFYLPTATNSRMTTDAGAADVELGCTLKTLDAVGQNWLVVRFVDASNFIRAGLKSGAWTIEAVVAGSATALATVTGASIAPANGQRMRVVAKSSTINLYVDGRMVATGTSTAGQTATKVGIQANNTTVRISSVYAKTA